MMILKQVVMPSLAPGIHAEPVARALRVFCRAAAWMAGTGPAMTGLAPTKLIPL
jgi:hypothetical protein